MISTMELFAQVDSIYLDSFEMTANKDSSVSMIGIPTWSIVSVSMIEAGRKGEFRAEATFKSILESSACGELSTYQSLALRSL